MSNFINRFSIIACLLIVFISCKKEGEKLILNADPSFSGSLTSSAQSIVLSSANDDDTVVTLSWPAVNYSQQAVVSYTVQMDLPADTSGEQEWVNAKSFPAGNYALSYGFTGRQLNNLLTEMGFAPDVSSPVAFRVISNVNQYNGSASIVPAVYSSTVSIPVTSYALSLYVPGDYQGWDPSKAPFLNPAPGLPGKFEGYYYMPGTGTKYFKYTNAPDWGHTNYGDGGNGLMTTDGLAGGLSVADGGYIEVTADFNTNTWTATKTDWGIIGDATPAGWDNSTNMIYDESSQTWKLTAVMKQAGSFKFRANNEWKIDFGIDADGHLQYADNPFFPYNGSLNNLTVPEDGTYLITLDLHVSGKYNYSVVKM